MYNTFIRATILKFNRLKKKINISQFHRKTKYNVRLHPQRYTYRSTACYKIALDIIYYNNIIVPNINENMITK